MPSVTSLFEKMWTIVCSPIGVWDKIRVTAWTTGVMIIWLILACNIANKRGSSGCLITVFQRKENVKGFVAFVEDVYFENEIPHCHAIWTAGFPLTPSVKGAGVRLLHGGPYVHRTHILCQKWKPLSEQHSRILQCPSPPWVEKESPWTEDTSSDTDLYVLNNHISSKEEANDCITWQTTILCLCATTCTDYFHELHEMSNTATRKQSILTVKGSFAIMWS